MKTALETVAVAFSMFSALPLPHLTWTPKNMRYALCAFPLVGLVIGGLWWAWAAVCAALHLPELGRAAGFCLLPVLVSGGIHLDGYADTCDALASHAPAEKKQEILSDPRCGAFAVIRLCTYFVAYFSLCGLISTNVKALACAVISFVFSRTLSGLAVATFPLAKSTGLAHTFATAAHRRQVAWTLGMLAALLIALAFVVSGGMGVLTCAVGLLVFWHYAYTAKSQFGGLSGDLAGWFLQRVELWMLGAMVAWQYLEVLL